LKNISSVSIKQRNYRMELSKNSLKVVEKIVVAKKKKRNFPYISIKTTSLALKPILLT